MSLVSPAPPMMEPVAPQYIQLDSPDTQKLLNGNGTPTVTLRMIMQGKEVGSIIGRKGDNVKKFREDSGAKINISDNSCLERIVTVMGTSDTVTKAFTMIAKKLEEDIQAIPNSVVPKPPVTMRLVVPASQCGSLIGKGGSKINEIREGTGASIQVASEMLPNSTERAVTISGSADAIGQSVNHICNVFVESPPKGATIPYRPKPPMLPVIYTAAGTPVAAAGAFGQLPAGLPPHFAAAAGIPSQPAELMKIQQLAMNQQNAAHLQLMPPNAMAAAASGQPLMPSATTPPSLDPALLDRIGQRSPPTSSAGPTNHENKLPSDVAPHHLAGLNFTLANSPGAANPNAQSQTHEMTIPNDLIGCIIGRGGCKINEIRQLSRATIKIANCEEGSSDRKVTIQGTPDTVNAAQYLINASMELHKSLSLTPVSPATLPPAGPGPSPLGVPYTSLGLKYPGLLGLPQGLQASLQGAMQGSMQGAMQGSMHGSAAPGGQHLQLNMFDNNMNAAAMAAAVAQKSALVNKLRSAAGGVMVQSNGTKKVENPVAARAKFSPY